MKRKQLITVAALAVVVLVGCDRTVSENDPEAAKRYDGERAPENTAAARGPHVTEAVRFIRQNRHRHKAASDACYEMNKCTM